ncbi:MAG: YggT family protein [Treponema sp.]|jgi:YggT family protein|nr:YggT family protein [Treponema sp.]
MRLIFSILAALTGFYSLLIFIRIIFSWLQGMVSGSPVEILNKITDPYLDWWKRKLNLRIGLIDFSAVAAIVSLSLLQSVFSMLSSADRLSVGNLLAVILFSLWSVASFIIGFCMIIIILRAIAYLTNRNIYRPFWSAVESISQPLMYNLNKLIFTKRTVNIFQGMIVSFILLALLMFGGRFAVNFVAGFLYRLPI